jgi:hypothetical protein
MNALRAFGLAEREIAEVVDAEEAEMTDSDELNPSKLSL